MLLRILILMLISIGLKAQSAYVHIGARAFQVDTAQFKEGPNVGLGVEYHPITSDLYPVQWSARAGANYNSVYDGGTKRFSDIYGSFGIYHRLGLYLYADFGYLFALEQGSSAPRIGGTMRMEFPAIGQLRIGLEGAIGTTISPILAKFENNMYISGAVMVSYSIIKN